MLHSLLHLDFSFYNPTILWARWVYTTIHRNVDEYERKSRFAFFGSFHAMTSSVMYSTRAPQNDYYYNIIVKDLLLNNHKN